MLANEFLVDWTVQSACLLYDEGPFLDTLARQDDVSDFGGAFILFRGGGGFSTCKNGLDPPLRANLPLFFFSLKVCHYLAVV